MKRRSSILSPLPVAFLCACLITTGLPTPAFGMRGQSLLESAGLEEVVDQLVDAFQSNGPDSDSTDDNLLLQLERYPQPDSDDHPYLKTQDNFHPAVAEPLLDRNRSLTAEDRTRLLKTVLPTFSGEIRLFDLSFLAVPVRLNTDGSIDIARQILEQAPAEHLIALFNQRNTTALLQWAHADLKAVTPAPASAVSRVDRFVAAGADRQENKNKRGRPEKQESIPADTLSVAAELAEDLFVGEGTDLADTLSAATLEQGLKALLTEAEGLTEPLATQRTEPAAQPSIPVPGTLITSSGQLQGEMSRRVQEVHAGKIPDNMAVMTGNGFDRDQISISVRVLPGSPVQTDVLIFPDSYLSSLFLPDPRVDSSASHQYQVVWDSPSVKREAEKNTLLEELKNLLKGDIERSRDSMPWLNKVLDATDWMLAEQGEEARIEAAKAAQPDRAVDIQRLLDIVLEKEVQYQELYGRLLRVFNQLEAQADEGGEIPAEAVRTQLQELAEHFTDYPRAEYALLDVARALPEGTTVSPKELRKTLSGVKVYLRRNHKRSIARQVPQEIIRDFYYEAKRVAQRHSFEELNRWFQSAGEDPPDAEREAVSQFALDVISHENSHLFSGWISTRFQRAGQPAQALPVSVLGVGFLNAKNQLRFIPGGVLEYDIPAEREAHWSGERILPSYQTGDRIALIFPSHGGGLTRSQINAFFEGWFSLMNENPEIPEILLGIAREDGSVRLLRPRISERGKEAWGILARMGNEITERYRPATEWEARMRTSGVGAWLVNDLRSTSGSLLTAAQQKQQSNMAGRDWWIRRFRVSEFLLSEVESLFGSDAAQAVREQWKANPRHAKTLQDLRDRLNLGEIEQKRPKEAASIRQRVHYIGRTADDLGYVFTPLVDLAASVVEERLGAGLLDTPWMFEEVPLFPEEPKPEQKERDWFGEVWAEWKKERRFEKNSAKVGKAEDAEPLARRWVEDRVKEAPAGQEPEFPWIDFSKALVDHRKREAQRREQMRARVEGMKTSAAAAALPEANPAQQVEALAQWSALSAELTASERAGIQPALVPVAQLLARPHGAWALAAMALNQGLFEPELPTSKLLNRLAAQLPMDSNLRNRLLQRRNIAEFNEKQAARQANGSPSEGTPLLPSDLRRDLLLLAERQMTDLDRLLEPFPEQQAVIREQRHWVRNLWMVEEVSSLGRSAAADDASRIRTAFGRLEQFAPDLDPDLAGALHRLSGRLIRRWADLDQGDAEALIDFAIDSDNTKTAYAALQSLDQALAADAQTVRRQGFAREAADLEAVRGDLASALEATEKIQKIESLAVRVTAEDGSSVHAELAVNQRLRAQAGLRWMRRLNQARHRLMDQFSERGERSARERLESVEQLPFEQADALARSIQEGMASLSEFPDLAARRAALADLRQQVRRRALKNPQAPPAAIAQFIVGQDAFQTVLNQERLVRTWLRTMAEGDSPKNTEEVLRQADRQQKRSSGVTQEFYAAVAALARPSVSEPAAPEPAAPEPPVPAAEIPAPSKLVSSVEPPPSPPAPVAPSLAPSVPALPALETAWKSKEFTLFPDQSVRIATSDPADFVQMEFAGRERLQGYYPAVRVNVVTSKRLMVVSGNELAAAEQGEQGDWRGSVFLLERADAHRRAPEGEWIHDSVLVYGGMETKLGIENEIYLLPLDDFQRLKEDLRVIAGSRKIGASGKRRFFEAKAIRLTVRFNADDQIDQVLPVVVLNPQQRYSPPVIETADHRAPLPELPRRVPIPEVPAPSVPPTPVSSAPARPSPADRSKQLSRAERMAYHDERLAQSTDPGEMAGVLLDDGRFSQAIDENFRVPSEDGKAKLRGWLESVKAGRMDVVVTRQLQMQRAAIGEVEGTNRQLFYQAFDRLLPFALQNSGASAVVENTAAGLEEPTAMLETGAIFRLVHRQSSRPVEIEVVGEKRVRVRAPKGWVPVFGKELAVVQAQSRRAQSRSWTSSDTLRDRLEDHRRALRKSADALLMADMEISQSSQPPYGIENLVWLIPMADLNRMLVNDKLRVTRTGLKVLAGETRFEEQVFPLTVKFLPSPPDHRTAVPIEVANPRQQFQLPIPPEIAAANEKIRRAGIALKPEQGLVIHLSGNPRAPDAETILVRYKSLTPSNDSRLRRVQLEVTGSGRQVVLSGRRMGARVDQVNFSELSRFVSRISDQARASSSETWTETLELSLPVQAPRSLLDRFQRTAVFYPVSELAEKFSEKPEFGRGVFQPEEMSGILESAPIRILLSEIEWNGLVRLRVVGSDQDENILLYPDRLPWEVLAPEQPPISAPVEKPTRQPTEPVAPARAIVPAVSETAAVTSPGTVDSHWAQQEVPFLSGSLLRLRAADPARTVQLKFREQISKGIALVEVRTPKGWIAVSGNEMKLAENEQGDWRQASSLQARLASHERAGEDEWVTDSLRIFAVRDPEQGVENEIYFLSVEDLRRFLDDWSVVVGSRHAGAPGKKRFFEQPELGLIVRLLPGAVLNTDLLAVTVLNLKQQYGRPKVGTPDQISALPSLPKKAVQAPPVVSAPVSAGVSAAAAVENNGTSARQRRETEMALREANDATLLTSKDTGAIAAVLKNDSRYASFAAEDPEGQVGPFLDSAVRRQPNAALAAQLQMRLSALKGQIRGDNRIAFHQALDRLISLIQADASRKPAAVRSEPATAGLEEPEQPDPVRAWGDLRRQFPDLLKIALEGPGSSHAFLERMNAVVRSPDFEAQKRGALMELAGAGKRAIDAIYDLPNESPQQREGLIRYIALYDGIAELILKELPQDNDLAIETADTVRRNRYGMQVDIEGLTRFNAIDSAHESSQHRLKAVAAQPLRLQDKLIFTHRYSRRQIRLTLQEIREIGKSRDITLAVFRATSAPGLVLLSGNALDYAEELRNEGKGNGWKGVARGTLRIHEKSIEGSLEPIPEEITTLARGSKSDKQRVWAFSSKDLDGWSRTSSPMVLKSKSQEALLNQYPDLSFQTVFRDAHSIRIDVDDALDLWTWTVVSPAASRAGLEEDIPLTAQDLMTTRQELFPGDELRLRLALTRGATASDLVIRYLGRGEGAHPGARFEVTLPYWMEGVNGNELQNIAMTPVVSWRDYLWDLLQKRQPQSVNPKNVLLELSRPEEKNRNNRTKLGFGTLSDLLEKIENAREGPGGLGGLFMSLLTFSLYDLPGNTAALVRFSNGLTRVDFKSAVLHRSAGLEENSAAVLAEIAEAIGRKRKDLPVRILGITEDELSVEVEYIGAAGTGRGVIPLSWVFQDPQKTIPLTLKLDWVSRQSPEKTFYAIPLQIKDGQPVFALGLSPAVLRTMVDPLVEELRAARREDRPVSVLLEKMIFGSEMARAWFLSEERSGGAYPGGMLYFQAFNDPERKIPLGFKHGWVQARIDDGNPVEAWVDRMEEEGPFPRVLFAARRSFQDLQKETADALADLRALPKGTKVPVKVLHLSSPNGGAKVLYRKGRSWTAGFVPASFFLQHNGSPVLTDLTAFLWVEQRLGGEMEAVLESLQESGEFLEPIFAFNLSVQEIRRSVQPALDTLADAARKGAKVPVTIREVTPGGATVVFEHPSGRIGGFLQVNHVKLEGKETGQDVKRKIARLRKYEGQILWAVPTFSRGFLDYSFRVSFRESQPVPAAGLEEPLPVELRWAMDSEKPVEVEVGDRIGETPFFEAVYTAPDGQKASGKIPISSFVQDKKISRWPQISFNQKWDRIKALSRQRISAQAKQLNGELYFYPDLTADDLEAALDRLLADMEKRVQTVPSTKLPARVMRWVGDGRYGVEVLYRLEDGRQGRGYLPAGDPQLRSWLETNMGQEIRVVPVQINRARDERPVMVYEVRESAESGPSDDLMDRELLGSPGPPRERMAVLQQWSHTDRDLADRLIRLYVDRPEVWRNLPSVHHLAVLQWLAGQGRLANPRLAQRMFDLFVHAWENPLRYGRTTQAWILRGMGFSAREEDQKRTARENIRAWFHQSKVPQGKHFKIVAAVVPELFGRETDARTLFLQLRDEAMGAVSPTRPAAGLEEGWPQFMNRDVSVRRKEAERLIGLGVHGLPELLGAFANIGSPVFLAEATEALQAVHETHARETEDMLVAAVRDRSAGRYEQARGAALALRALGPGRIRDQGRVIAALEGLLSPHALRGYWVALRGGEVAEGTVGSRRRSDDHQAAVLTWGKHTLPAAALALARLDPTGETLEKALDHYERVVSQTKPQWIASMAEREMRTSIDAALKQGKTPKGRTGLEEAEPRTNRVFFLDAGLVDPAVSGDPNSDLMLIGLTIDLKRVIGWDEQERGDLQIVLVLPENRGKLRELYAGFHIVEIRRAPGSDPRPLPVQAIPSVVLDAMAFGRDLFRIAVTPYLDLGRYSMPDVWQILTEQYT